MTSLFTLIFTFNAYSQQVKKVDINGDGKVDRFEIYQGTQLIRIDEDRNGDGKIDYKTILKSDDFVKQTQQDTNFDGKFNRIETFRSGTGKKYEGKIRIKIQVDKDHDGKFEIEYQTVVDKVQRSVGAPCPQPSILDEGLTLLEKATNYISSKLNNGYIPTGKGHLVDPGCAKKWGDNFNDILNGAISEGLQCLKKLGASTQGQTGSDRLAYELENLLSKGNITVSCTAYEGDEQKWAAVMAYASADPSSVMIDGQNNSIKHPYMMINPNYPNADNEAQLQSEISELRKTIFHEQIHNLGFGHNDDIEYSFACEDCCLSYEEGEDAKKQVAAACKVCQGNYTDRADINYLRDMMSYGSTEYLHGFTQSATLNYIKENPDDPKGVAYMAKAFINDNNPMGYFIAIEYNKKGLAKNDPEAQKILDEIISNANMANYADQKSARVIGGAIYMTYVEKNSNLALKLLEKYKGEITNSLKSFEDEAFVDETKSSLDKLMNDLYFNDYLESDEFNTLGRSSELYQYFQANLP